MTNATRSVPVRFRAARDVLAYGATLMQVTSGPRGEVLALAVDPMWWTPETLEFPKPPYTYYVTVCREGVTWTLRLTDVNLPLTHVQPWGAEGFLIMSRASMRGPAENALIVGTDGTVRASLSISRGIENIQVDRAGNLWVANGDQSAFSRQDLAFEGLVCFSPDLEPRFRFNSLAHRRGLPPVCGCSALNVASDHDAWAYYSAGSGEYSLVQIHDCSAANAWRITSVLGANALAVDGMRVLFAGAYRNPGQLTLLDLETGNAEEIVATDPDGQPIHVAGHRRYHMASGPAWGRGNTLYLLDARGVWELDLTRALTLKVSG